MWANIFVEYLQELGTPLPAGHECSISVDIPHPVTFLPLTTQERRRIAAAKVQPGLGH